MNAPAAPSPPPSGKLLKPVLAVASLLFIVLLQYGFIFLLIALLPAIVAYFIDHTPGRAAFKVVVLCNVAAMLPSLMPMLNAAIRTEHVDAMRVMGDPFVWLTVYGGAAIGWGLIFLCRFIARFFVVLYFEYQVVSLERFQKKLLSEWGDQIRGPAPG